MRLLFLLSLLLLFQKTFGQFGVIQMSDGYVNVRDFRKEIIDTLHNGHIINYDWATEENDTVNWFEIQYEKSGEKTGFIHRSGFIPISKYEIIPEIQQTENKVIFQNKTIKITLTRIPFQSAQNKFYSVEGRPVINGKRAWGILADTDHPETQYGQISIIWKAIKIDLPKESFENLFWPNLKNTRVYFDKIRNRLYISSLNSDGAAVYDVLWIIENGKYKSMFVFLDWLA